MPQTIQVEINGQPVEVKRGTTVASAVNASGLKKLRRSVRGEKRGALCGIGICCECRVEINGRPHKLSCYTLCREGMKIQTA